ncbi:MAG: hypothetical protein ABI789_14345 [Usitatibacter sp.]
MTVSRRQKIPFAITALLFSTLACRAATRLIIPDTPTPQPTLTATFAPTLTPFPPPVTPTFEYIASCPLVLDQIVKDSTSSDESPLNGSSIANTNLAYLVEYVVSGDELKNPHLESVPNRLKAEQQNRASHEEIWKYFTRLIPADQRALVNGFSIFTDGKDNILAAVNQSDRDANQWELNVDFADASLKTSLTFTLLHEFGHLLTLNSAQAPVDLAVYKHPDDETLYQREVDACPQYFTGEGCSNPDSYINQFFERFWTDLYAEWQAIDAEKDEDTRLNMIADFYKTYQDQFLTDYAPTSPAEDIAESWAFFILAPKPESNSIANEKILFFYEYPELVQLREQILDKICVEFQ